MNNSTVHSNAAHDELVLAAKRLVDLVHRRWKTFLAIFVVFVPAVLLVTFLWPGTFEAHAAVLLQKTRSTSALDYDPKQPTTVVTGSVSEAEVNSEIAVLTSRAVLEATVKATGLGQLTAPWYVRLVYAPLRAYERAYDWFHDISYPTGEERATTGLGNALSVERLKDSNVLIVSYRMGNPRLAETVLNQLLKEYLDWHVKVHTHADAQRFFDTQTARLSRELTSLQEEQRRAKQAVGVVDIEQARQVALQQHATLQQEESALARRSAELEGKLASYQQAMAASQAMIRTATTSRPSSQALDTMRAQLLQLQIDQIRLEARYVPTARPVVENQRKLDAARKAIDAVERTVPEDSTEALNPTALAIQQQMTEARAEAAGVQDRLSTVRAQIRALHERLGELDQQATASERIELQIQSAKDRYAMYLDRAERARMDAALDRTGMTDASIIQHAAAAPKPVRPGRLISLIIAILGGLIAAALVCAWQELMEMGLAESLEHAAPRPESAQPA